MGGGTSVPNRRFDGVVSVDQRRLGQMHDLDVVLMRTKTRGANVQLSHAVARGIKVHYSQHSFYSHVELPQWDRVGLIFFDQEWSSARGREKLKWARVTYAGGSGLETKTLAEVCDDCVAVVVRPLVLPDDEHKEENKDEEDEEEEYGSDFGEDSDTESDDDNPLARENVSMNWFRLVASVVGKQWKDCGDGLRPLMKAMKDEIAQSKVKANLVERVEALVEEIDPNGLGMDLEQMMSLFAVLHVDKELGGTFSQSEILDLMSRKIHGLQLVSKKGFVSAWVESYKRTRRARNKLKQVVSGFFMSYAFQRMGLIPELATNFFLPEDFGRRVLKKKLLSRKWESGKGNVEEAMVFASLGEEITIKG